jgi:hypothetical protein
MGADLARGLHFKGCAGFRGHHCFWGIHRGFSRTITPMDRVQAVALEEVMRKRANPERYCSDRDIEPD